MSAGVWDDWNFVEYLFERDVLSQVTDEEVPAIKTEDGLIVLGDDAARIKALDPPVTYDNDGNVIPLSERFNQEEPDIRWSAETEDEYRQTAATPALEKLGIRLAGSKGRYDLSEQLLARDKAAKELMRATKKAEKKLKAARSLPLFVADLAENAVS